MEIWRLSIASWLTLPRRIVKRIVCLGDTVGYGPNPRECVDRVLEMGACVLGNHDYGALIDPEGFSSAAEQAIFWTRKQLESGPDETSTRRRLSFLANLPVSFVTIKKTCSSSMVRSAIRLNEYVFPEDVHNRRKMEKLFSMLQGYLFPGAYPCSWNFYCRYDFCSPEESDGILTLGTRKPWST